MESKSKKTIIDACFSGFPMMWYWGFGIINAIGAMYFANLGDFPYVLSHFVNACICVLWREIHIRQKFLKDQFEIIRSDHELQMKSIADLGDRWATKQNKPFPPNVPIC